MSQAALSTLYTIAGASIASSPVFEEVNFKLELFDEIQILNLDTKSGPIGVLELRLFKCVLQSIIWSSRNRNQKSVSSKNFLDHKISTNLVWLTRRTPHRY